MIYGLGIYLLDLVLSGLDEGDLWVVHLLREYKNCLGMHKAP